MNSITQVAVFMTVLMAMVTLRGAALWGSEVSENLLRNSSDDPRPSVPEPVPPIYTRLKDLHLTTGLVKDSQPNITIIAPASGIYGDQAEKLQKAITELTGVQVPIAKDISPAGAVPIHGNLIVLGNRSTNKTIEELYNRYYTLLDLRYPGSEGYVVRTLHNPFGDGHSVIFAGGSDLAGVDAAADGLIRNLKEAGAKPGSLSVGWLAEIRLGKGVTLPTDIKNFETWEASAGYGSTGYFGWNSLSKRMAMYYMTGDEFQAREALRLAFPDEQAKKEITQIDGERIENKDDPLAGPYHYNAHLMILFWDLIEESPVFTDEERLKVTNAFARQLTHRKDEGIYGLTEPMFRVDSRHHQWSAISLYCLGRYFRKDYPDPVWKHCVEASGRAFASLHQHAWVYGESDNLFWYSTGAAPILTYQLLSGDRKPVENGALQSLLRGQEILITGKKPDWALTYAALDYLHKAAYLTQDGRWLAYRDRTGLDLNVFRLGQSFWPEEHLIASQPLDLVNKWSIHSLPQPMWQMRESGLPFAESFQYASYRSAPDASGDFMLIDGYNGAGRNPYHTFALLELRLDGHTLLQGYRNQLLTKVDGLVEPVVAMDAALRRSDVIGQTVTAVAEVPGAAYCNWKRTLVQRIGRYALIVDDLKSRTDTDNLEVQFLWERPEGWSDSGGILSISRPQAFEVQQCDPVKPAVNSSVATLRWQGPVKTGQHRIFFTLIGSKPKNEPQPQTCFRLADNAAILSLPSPALAVVGKYGGLQGDLAVLVEDHLYGQGLRSAGFDEKLLSADAPVDLDWDFTSGRLHIVAYKETRLSLALESSGSLHLDGKPETGIKDKHGFITFRLAPGRHLFEAARPSEAILGKRTGILAALSTDLPADLMERHHLMIPGSTETDKAMPSPKTVIETSLGGKVVDMILIPLESGTLICAAEGKTVHILTSEGKKVRTLQTDGPIRKLRWWKEHNLLLVGCQDEKVIAFDLDGSRKWTFISEMDPAVFRAAKDYWFKSAPGHKGIHGLYTGVFLDGKSQAFVGSACTLEILDEKGQLVKRMPVFWGTGSVFAIIQGPEGSLNLLQGRSLTDGPWLAIISNRTLDPTPRGFYSVPPGHTYVGGWGDMNRSSLFYEDMDGDGKKEIVSEINGVWNRVTVWNEQGEALYNAQFGPGESVTAGPIAKNMRALNVADLDGDGKKEILAATSGGLVVALDHRCRKLWSYRLPSPPAVMKTVTSQGANPGIVVGCEDGSVMVLDGRGKLISQGSVTGQTTCIEDLSASDTGAVVLLATDQGIVKGFNVERGKG